MKYKFDEFRCEESPSVTMIEAYTSSRTCIKLCECEPRTVGFVPVQGDDS